MAWVALENFDSYTPTNDLNGGSGGSGWSGNWVATASKVIISTTQAISGNSARLVADGTNPTAVRIATTSTASGNFYYYFLTTSLSNDNRMILQDTLPDYKAYIQVDTSGNIQMRSAGSWHDTGFDVSINTWNCIRIEINADDTCRIYQYIGVPGAGSWSSASGWWAGDGTGNAAGVYFNAEGSGGGYVYIDCLGGSDPTVPAGPASLKTINGLAKASVKTINGLALGSVKTFNGLT